jgi:hypothetical protein
VETLSLLLRPIGLALWGLVLVQSALSGRLDLLVRATFHPLIVASGTALLVLAALNGVHNQRHRESTLRRRPGGRERTALLVGAAIAVAMLLLPPVPSFADLASNRPSGQL